MVVVPSSPDLDSSLAVVLAAALPLAIVGLVLAARAWQEQRKAPRAGRWPHIPGRIVSAGVEQTTVRVRIRTSIRRYRTAVRYGPQVVYAYVVNGSMFQAERLALGPRLLSSERADAEQVAARYPVGSQVRVYYDPDNPAEATLDPRIGWGTRTMWLAAALVLATAVTVVVIGLR